MKIVYFFPNLKDSAGTERMLNVKANYFADVLNYDITIITYRQFDDPIFYDFSNKIKFVHFNIPDPTSNLKGLGYFKKRKLYKNFMSTYRKKVEEYLYYHPTDVAISMYFGAEHKFLPLIKDGSKKILEYHFHFDITPLSKKLKAKWNLTNIRSKIQTRSFQKTLNKYDHIIVLTEEDQKEWEVYFNNVINIPNPITIEPIITDPKIKQVLAVGRFTYQKGFNYLIDAWSIIYKNFPDWKLNIYGSGELEDELKQSIIDNNLQESVFLYPPEKNINKIFAQHSIFTLSSRFEGFPLVLIEALSSGLVPVSFQCKNGPKQMMSNTQLEELLVKPFNVKEFADKLKLLMQKEQVRIQLSKESILIAEQYKLDKIMDKWNKTFNKLIVQNKKIK